MCDKDPGCMNSKILVLDTNFLDQINRTVKGELKAALGKPFPELRPMFLKHAKEIISHIGCCGGNHVFTTDKVYNDEINVSKVGSALKQGDMEFFGELCSDDSFSDGRI